MPKKPETNLEKVNVRLYKDDLALLTEIYNPNGKGVGYNEIIRTLVHAHCKALREKIAQKQGENHDRANTSSGSVIPT